MKLAKSGVLVAAIVCASSAASDVFAREYDPRTGRFLQNEPLLHLRFRDHYTYAGNNPVSNVDPDGKLQRRQVEWLAQKYVKNWPGVGPASPEQLKEAIKTIKEELRKIRPDKFKGSNWHENTEIDDKDLQDLINVQKKAGNKEWDGFPGDVYEPAISDVAKIYQVIADARKVVPAPEVSSELLVSWVMYESNWRRVSSPYGWSIELGKGRISSAVGLLQMTATTYQSPEMVRNRPPGLPAAWGEAEFVNPATSIAAGMHVLLRKSPGGTIKDKLVGYKGEGGERYATDVLTGEKVVRDYLQKVQRGLDKLDAQQGREMLDQLRRAIGR
jgi:hypothetical protein